MFRWPRFRQKPATAATIQQQLGATRHRHQQATKARDALALAVESGDPDARTQYQRLDADAAQLAHRMQILSAALPMAEAREDEIAKQAEAEVRSKRIEEFFRLTHEAHRFLDSILAQQVTGEELTQARELSLLLSREADALHRLTGDGQFRRPLDPFAAIRDALVHRIERIDRARWAKSAPITLLDHKQRAS